MAMAESDDYSPELRRLVSLSQAIATFMDP
jgi:hypothetical protein